MTLNSEQKSQHWNTVYGSKNAEEVSWYQRRPALSLELIETAGIAPKDAVIDIGAGASHLAEHLIEKGFSDITALDLSAQGLKRLVARLGAKAVNLDAITADVTTWVPPRTFTLWHDRAAFHFLATPHERAAYVATLTRALPVGGFAIIATFDLNGPETCSGLPVQRYSSEGVAQELGAGFVLRKSTAYVHETPKGAQQSFQYALLERIA